MWKIISLFLIIHFNNTESADMLEFISKGIFDFALFLLKIQCLTSDSFLDKTYWREQDRVILRKYEAKAAYQNTECSYVEDILHKNYTSGYIDIVISPLVTEVVNLSMYHYVRVIFQVTFEEGDVILLYVASTDSNDTSQLIPLSNKTVSSFNQEFVDTEVLYNAEDIYFADYLRYNGKVVAKTRFHRTKPSWMWCMRDSIRDSFLNKMFIPGTHDSGSYIKPAWWQNKCAMSKVYYNYVYTQEDSIFSQLMQGARYLDLRIGKYKAGKNILFYVNHNSYKVHFFIDILDQVKEFIRISPHEIIIMDFHLFPVGFDKSDDHDQLAQFLIEHLGELIYRHPGQLTWEVKIGDIWKTKSRIIIAYNNYITAVKYKFFPAVDQLWSEEDQLLPFITFMDGNIPGSCTEANCRMQSAMTELTPTLYGILSNKYEGLRSLANLTNSIITNKFAVGSWGESVQAAAVDFLSSTGIVSAAIRQNALRAELGHVCH